MGVRDDDVIRIAGAGLAGLAAAIALARAGRRVVVHEVQREVGYRFQGDLQGLENWTTERDVHDEMSEMGLTTVFARRACREGTAFDAWGQVYPVRSDAPLFYMVERGPGRGCVYVAADRRGIPPPRGAGDAKRALARRGRELPYPRVGLVRVASDRGRASGVSGHAVGLRHTARDPLRRVRGAQPHGRRDYEARWRKELGPWLRASVVNRALYGLRGNAGYRWALRQQAGRDAREFLLREEALRHIAEPTYRIWRLCMAACALCFEDGGTGVYQILAASRAKGLNPVPLTRRDLYRQG